MNSIDVVRMRLSNQGIAPPKFTTPAEVVRFMGAIQAQDYLASLWAIGLRMKHTTEGEIEKAIAERKIVRTWPMRRTIHWVAPEDAKWMLSLTAKRMVEGSKNRALERFGITDKLVEESKRYISQALEKRKIMTRDELYEVMSAHKYDPKASRGLHLLVRIAQEGLICFGPRRGKQPTFVLLDEWVTKSKKLSREEALAELVVRYFSSHGPATVQDLMWWSGLPGKDIKEGINLAKSKLVSETIDGKSYWISATKSKISDQRSQISVHLLPPFDEYFVAYKDRSEILEAVHHRHINPGNGMFAPIIVVNGQVVGTWKRTIKKDSVRVTSHYFVKTSPHNITAAVEKYGAFLGLTHTLT